MPLASTHTRKLHQTLLTVSFDRDPMSDAREQLLLRSHSPLGAFQTYRAHVLVDHVAKAAAHVLDALEAVALQPAEDVHDRVVVQRRDRAALLRRPVFLFVVVPKSAT